MTKEEAIKTTLDDVEENAAKAKKTARTTLEDLEENTAKATLDEFEENPARVHKKSVKAKKKSAETTLEDVEENAAKTTLEDVELADDNAGEDKALVSMEHEVLSWNMKCCR